MHKHDFEIYSADIDEIFLECKVCGLIWKNGEIIELIEKLVEDVNKMAPLWETHFPKTNVVFPKIETSSNSQVYDKDRGFLWLGEK